MNVEETQFDSDDDRPPLPCVPPPPLSPSTTPPPTPASPSPRLSDSPLLKRNNDKDNCPREKSANKESYQPPPPKKYLKLGRSVSVKETSLRDPFLDMLQSRNPLSDLDKDQNEEFNLDLDNFSRELMSVFEDLDAKIGAQKETEGVCAALLPKSIRSRELTTAKKKIDSQNYVVNSSGVIREKEPQENIDESIVSGKSEDKFVESTPCLIASDYNHFNSREKDFSSPSKRFDDNNVPEIQLKKFNNLPSHLNRSSSFISLTGNKDIVPKTIINQSYCQDYRIISQAENEKFREKSNIKRSSLETSSNNIHTRTDGKNNRCKEGSTQKSQPQAQTHPKSGFRDFCNRLKQRSNVYRQYVKQVIEKAPKLDGYDSDTGETLSGKIVTSESLRASPNPESKNPNQPKMSDGAPVNIFGTVRKPPQEVGKIGRAIRNVRDVFNAPIKQEIHQLKNGMRECEGRIFDGQQNKARHSANRTEEYSFSANSLITDNALKRRTSFQSLLDVFDSPQVRTPTSRPNANKERSNCNSERRPYAPKEKEWFDDRDSKFNGFGNLASSKRFVSCLEIRLGK